MRMLRDRPQAVYKNPWYGMNRERIMAEARSYGGKANVPLSVRFWWWVEKTEDCWLWRGAISQGSLGYGQFQIDGSPHLVHRVSWELKNGPIPDGACVLHRCDNPRCVRVEHLFLGTALDNALDRDLKGRQHKQRGETANHVMLSESNARLILALAKQSQIAQQKIADHFGITQSTVSAILRGRTWKYLQENL